MSKSALYIVEGERSEPRFLKKMWKTYMNRKVDTYSYCTNIHVLIDILYVDGRLDEDLDILRCLRGFEKDPEKREILSKEYNDVFLVFDMDPQDPRIDVDKIKSLMEFFDDSSNNGKLYLNYPMMESYKHLRSMDDQEFKDRKISVSDCGHYKKMVNEECCEMLKSLNSYDRSLLIDLALLHIMKANYMVCDRFDLPTVSEFISWGKTQIYQIQCDSIAEDGTLYVLNTCVFNMIDYRPSDFLRDL